MDILRQFCVVATTVMLAGCVDNGAATTATITSGYPGGEADVATSKPPATTTRTTAEVATDPTAAATSSTANTPDFGGLERLASTDPLVAFDAMVEYLRSARDLHRAIDDIAAPGTTIDVTDTAHLASGADLTRRITRNDGIRADIETSVGPNRQVVTLLRWEGRWLLADIVMLRDQPPLVIVETGTSTP